MNLFVFYIFTNKIIHFLYVLLSSPYSPDDKLVEQQSQREENQALDDGGNKHPAQNIQGKWILVGINAVATEKLDLDVHPGQLHQAIPKVELREDEEGEAQPLEDVLDELQEERSEVRGEKRVHKTDLMLSLLPSALHTSVLLTCLRLFDCKSVLANMCYV